MIRVPFLLIALVLNTGCNLPRDADGTVEHVRGRIIRVGITESAPWVSLQGSAPKGIEVTLVEGLAREISARPEWIRGSESELLHALKERRLDLVIGGFTADSPWRAEVAFTRPYEGGKKATHVFVTAPGENAWLVLIERYLNTHGPEVFARRGS